MELSKILAKCDHTLLAQTSTWAEIKAICDTGYFNENEIGSYKDIEARILSDGEPTPYYSYPTLEEQCGESEDDFS